MQKLVFEKNANFFAENCQKSQKIVIITSTPGQTDYFDLIFFQTPKNGWIIKRAPTPDTPETGCTSSTVPSSPNSEAECHADEESAIAPLHSAAVDKNVRKAKYFLRSVDKDLQRIREKQARSV
jgi:hypothetical protein